VRTGIRGREREIKEMGVESGQRRSVLGIINYSGTDGNKKFLEQKEEKDEERGVEEKKNGEHIHYTDIKKLFTF
jgi:hypothetical protein